MEGFITFVGCVLFVILFAYTGIFYEETFNLSDGVAGFCAFLTLTAVAVFINLWSYKSEKKERERVDELEKEGKWWLRDKSAEKEFDKYFYDYLAKLKVYKYFSYNLYFQTLCDNGFSAFLLHDKHLDHEKEFYYYNDLREVINTRECKYCYVEKGEQVYKAMYIDPRRMEDFLDNEERNNRLSEHKKYVDGYGKLFVTTTGKHYYENYKILLLPKGLPPIYSEIHTTQREYDFMQKHHDKSLEESIKQEEREKRKEILEKKSIKRI